MFRQPDVRKMLRSMSARQFSEWEAYAETAIMDDVREDYRSAQLAQILFNMNVSKGKERPLEDFVLKWTETPQAELTAEEKQAKVDDLAARVIAFVGTYNQAVEAEGS